MLVGKAGGIKYRENLVWLIGTQAVDRQAVWVAERSQVRIDLLGG